MIPGLAQWVKDPALVGDVVQVTDLAQIWRCCGCGVAVAPIRPLAWEAPCAMGTALKRPKKKKKKKLVSKSRYQTSMFSPPYHRKNHRLSPVQGDVFFGELYHPAPSRAWQINVFIAWHFYNMMPQITLISLVLQPC